MPQHPRFAGNSYSGCDDASFPAPAARRPPATAEQLTVVLLSHDPANNLTLSRIVCRYDAMAVVKQALTAAGAEFSSSTGQLNLVHRDYLRAFVDELPRHLHAFIASHKPTCEDLMLNFLVANATRAPPVRFVPHRGCYRPEAAASNMHSATHLRPTEWHHRRTSCLNTLVAAFGRRMPLRHSNCSFASTATLHLLPRRGSGLLGEPNASRAAFHKGRAERLAKLAGRMFGGGAG